jgi:hypothetical protein
MSAEKFASTKETATKLASRQFRWEAVKALAGILAACAVMTGVILALSNYLHPANQQPMFPPGTVIIIPDAPAKMTRDQLFWCVIWPAIVGFGRLCSRAVAHDRGN